MSINSGGSANGKSGGSFLSPSGQENPNVIKNPTRFQNPPPRAFGNLGNQTTEIFSPKYFGEPNYSFNQQPFGGGKGYGGKGYGGKGYGGGGYPQGGGSYLPTNPNNLYTGWQGLAGNITPIQATTQEGWDIPSNAPTYPMQSFGGGYGGGGKSGGGKTYTQGGGKTQGG